MVLTRTVTKSSTMSMFSQPDASTDASVLTNDDSALISTSPKSSTAFKTNNVSQRRNRGTPTPSNSSTRQMATELLSSTLTTLNKRDKHSAFGEFIAQELLSRPPHESEGLRANLLRALLAFSESCGRLY